MSKRPRESRVLRRGKWQTVWRGANGKFCKKPWVEVVVDGGPMVPRSIRVELNKWNAFVEWCKKHGTSTCFEIRAFMDARLGGEAIVTSRQPLVLHQTVRYVVDRPRRKARMPEPPEEVTVEEFGSPERCAHCEGQPKVYGHLWTSPSSCNAMYLCGTHHDHYRKRPGARYSFKPL